MGYHELHEIAIGARRVDVCELRQKLSVYLDRGKAGEILRGLARIVTDDQRLSNAAVDPRGVGAGLIRRLTRPNAP